MKKFPQQHQDFSKRAYLPIRKQLSALYTLAALAVVAGGYSAYTQYNNGKAIKAINDRNAAQADQDAMIARRDAAIQANQDRARQKYVLSKQRVAFLSNGAAEDFGSPLLVEANSAGYLEAGNLETERQGGINSSKLREQAVLDRMRGSAALSAAKGEATSTLLNTAASTGSFAYSAKH